MSPGCTKRQISNILRKYHKSAEIDIVALLSEISPLFGRIPESKYRYAGDLFNSELRQLGDIRHELRKQKLMLDLELDIVSVRDRIKLLESEQGPVGVGQDEPKDRLVEIVERLEYHLSETLKTVKEMIRYGIRMFDCGALHGRYVQTYRNHKDRLLDEFIEEVEIVGGERRSGADERRTAELLAQRTWGYEIYLTRRT